MMLKIRKTQKDYSYNNMVAILHLSRKREAYLRHLKNERKKTYELLTIGRIYNKKERITIAKFMESMEQTIRQLEISAIERQL